MLRIACSHIAVEAIENCAASSLRPYLVPYTYRLPSLRSRYRNRMFTSLAPWHFRPGTGTEPLLCSHPVLGPAITFLRGTVSSINLKLTTLLFLEHKADKAYCLASPSEEITYCRNTTPDTSISHRAHASTVPRQCSCKPAVHADGDDQQSNKQPVSTPCATKTGLHLSLPYLLPGKAGQDRGSTSLFALLTLYHSWYTSACFFFANGRDGRHTTTMLLKRRVMVPYGSNIAMCRVSLRQAHQNVTV